MKRIILGALLLAGLAFACEKEESTLLDQPPDVTQQKQALAQDFVGLLKLSYEFSAEDMAKLKTLEESGTTNVSPSLFQSSKGLIKLDKALKTINTKILALRQELAPADMATFLESGWREYLPEGFDGQNCEEIFYDSFDGSNEEYDSCLYYDRPNCFLYYETAVSMALYRYQLCVAG
jgi:hypothetical protein